MPLPRAVSASDAKARFYEVLDQARKGEVIQIIRRSRPEAILLGMEKYQELMERLEDLEDSLDLLRAEAESEGMIPWEEVKKRLSAEAGVQG